MKVVMKPEVLEATHYDGSFDLSFLADDERVGRTADGTDDICITRPDSAVRVRVGRGDWVVRYPDGHSTVCSALFFHQTYEPVP